MYNKHEVIWHLTTLPPINFTMGTYLQFYVFICNFPIPYEIKITFYNYGSELGITVMI
jgi:hypothetical protein